MKTLALPANPSFDARSPAVIRAAPEIQAASPVLLKWFTWYCRRYARRHFHSLRVLAGGMPESFSGLPVVVYSNHASWWDAIVCFLLKKEFFFDRRTFAPMDSAMLQRYRFFGRLGFFGVRRGSPGGAKDFLRTAGAILQQSDALLAITPQGRFTDVRERPASFDSGLGHLAARLHRAVFLPLAIEYVFWEERLPEILVHFGEPRLVHHKSGAVTSASDWTATFERDLASAQDELATAAQRRDSKAFRMLLRGGAGQGGIYDRWRSWKAKWRGESFNPEHGNL